MLDTHTSGQTSNHTQTSKWQGRAHDPPQCSQILKGKLQLSPVQAASTKLVQITNQPSLLSVAFFPSLPVADLDWKSCLRGKLKCLHPASRAAAMTYNMFNISETDTSTETWTIQRHLRSLLNPSPLYFCVSVCSLSFAKCGCYLCKQRMAVQAFYFTHQRHGPSVQCSLTVNYEETRFPLRPDL